jgi:protein-tyrosine phosphatase
VRICFVCLGNICRSPTAEGIMLKLVKERGQEGKFVIDSAGTAGYHTGEPPDPRTLSTAKARGVHLPSRARRFTERDFARFDLVIAMDQRNASDLRKLATTPEAERKVRLLREFDASAKAARELDVPDPYFGGQDGFEQVFDICEAACAGLYDYVLSEAEP